MVAGVGDGAALIIRMHHCIADGIALARVMLSLADSEPNAGIRRASHRRLIGSRLVVGGIPIPGTKPVTRALGLGSSLARQAAHVATSPRHAANLAGEIGRDEVTVGLMVDAKLVPDPGKIVRQLEEELRELAKLSPTRQRSRSPARKQSVDRGRATVGSTQ